jgi:hypothetical protein
MLNFEEVRAHVRTVFELKNDDPYLITAELKLSDGRRQGIYLAELEAENGRRYLRISSPIAPLAKSNAERALRFNWAQRVGYFALDDLDGEPYLHLCENRPYEGITGKELEAVIGEIGLLSDGLEKLISNGQDLL